MNPRAGASPLRADFDGLCVLSLESRRAAEIERLIRSQSGVPFVAPSMREVPLEHNSLALDFAARVLEQSPAGGDSAIERTGVSPLCAVERFDMVIFLTGVGARLLNQIIETQYPPGAFIEALRRLAVVVRGSKPAAVMREWGVPVSVTVPEPNTWREILAATEGRPERRIAVQEYGRPATELIAGLRARGAEVVTVPVYQWDLPEDTGPLREAARRLAAAEFDVILFTTSVQFQHLMKVAAEENLEAQILAALPRMVVGSVGPSTTETLRDFGVEPDLEPSHPKMGFLVNETARRAREILQSKESAQA
jgi:uroporphyrinogen-III synthase